jgi:hypothetical protein
MGAQLIEGHGRSNSSYVIVAESVKAEKTYWQMSLQYNEGYMRKYKVGMSGFKAFEMVQQVLQSKHAQDFNHRTHYLKGS